MEAEVVKELEVNVEQTGPQGLSAYEVYVQNGGTLSETDWLESLKGSDVDLSGYATKEDLHTHTNKSILDSITQEDIDRWNNNSGSGLTTEQVNALNEMFKVCAYIKEDVSTEYGAFKTAFGIGGGTVPTKTLQSISATYTGGNVTVGTSVNSLTGITVKANYSDGSQENVTNYTLSGNITEGNNIITVSYEGLTTTFIVVGIPESTGGEETNVSNETTWTDGVAYTYTAVNNEYVETSGEIKTYNNWNRTPYLYCKGASKLRFVVNKASSMFGTNNYYNVFYDENKNFISSFSYDGIDGNTVGSYKDVEIPNNAAYFILSHKAGIIGESTSLNSGYMVGFIPYK